MIVAPERVSTKLILLVDDDPVLLQALPEALRLRMEEVNVETCDSAERALQRITEVDYEAIVTDIKMPGTDGLALLAQKGLAAGHADAADHRARRARSGRAGVARRRLRLHPEAH